MFSYIATLEINKCKKEDSGIYKIVVSNCEGEAIAKTNLEIIIDGRAKNKTSNVSDETVNLLSRKNSFVKTEKQPHSSNYSSSTISIDTSMFSDCDSVNTDECSFLCSSNSSASSSETLTAEPIMNRVLRKDPLEYRTVFIGSPFTFYYDLIKKPTSIEVWEKDGKKLNYIKDLKLEAVQVNIPTDFGTIKLRYMLKAEKAGKIHEGNYTFTVSHQEGILVKHFVLKVKEKRK